MAYIFPILEQTETAPMHNLAFNFTREAFEAWLVSKAATGDTVVGRSCSSGRCPIAMFLNEMDTQWQHCVGPKTYTPYSPYHIPIPGENNFNSYPLPGWAKEFIRLVDRSNAYAIKAGFALQILDLVLIDRTDVYKVDHS
jgi:hypothetical protein